MASVDDPRRQFDFWIGEWDVHTPEGRLAGRNVITAIVEGHGLREEWRGAGGLTGTSLNAWSDERQVWHQTWIDSSGTLLLLDGGLRDGAMVIEGDGRSDDGRAVRHRITWSTVEGDPDRLRQHWEMSDDAGRTWETAFDGRYERVEPKPG